MNAVANPVSSRGWLCLLLVVTAACSDSTGPKEPADAIKIAVGEMRAIDPATMATLHVSGRDTGAEYTLIASYAAQSGGPIPLHISGDGTTPVSGPPSPRRVPYRDWPFFERSRMESASAFEMRLHTIAREQLTRYFPAARAAYAKRSMTAFSTDPPAVGTEMQLNVSIVACGTPDLHTGRITAVSDHAVIVEDEANPSGGFAQSDYDSIVQEFETLVYPVLTQNFGAPTDVDNNGGRILVFITRGVNELSAPGEGLITSGFEYARDLVPKATCAGSNEAELLYLAAPDPAGAIGNVLATARARDLASGTLAYTGQSLISDGRRLYVTQSSLESPWLKQGLSAIAEELVFFKAVGAGPRQNLTLDFLRSSTAILDAANKYQAGNLAKLAYYLREPESHSPFLADGTIAASGVGWQFLRFVADHSAVAEPTLWFNLVNSNRVGVANLAAAAGVDVYALEHQWAIAQYADDAGLSVASAFQQPSWNFRNVMSAFTSDGSFPLEVNALADGVPLSLQLTVGGAAYVRFGAPASKFATLHITSDGTDAAMASLSLTLLRTK